MFPLKFIERIKTQEYLNADSLLEALREPSPVSIRINPIKWKYQPSGSEPVPWCVTGFYLKERPSFTLDPVFHAGCYYPQEASSMFIEHVFNSGIINRMDLRILDLCAAPGGKATHLSSLAGNEALIVANDPIRSRARLLADNLIKWGTSNTLVTQNDPSGFTRLGEFFDLIVIDAPCSGEGMFRDDAVRKEWSEENAHHCSLRQRRILKDAWPALKENGILIYSTCTFNPAENEDNICWLLENPEAESVEIDISKFEGIVSISKNKMTGYGFYPDRIRGEGFFISIVRKREKGSKWKGKLNQGSVTRPSSNELKVAVEWSDFDSNNIVKIGDSLYGIPGTREEFGLLTGILNIIKPGTKISTLKNKDFLPSPDLALSTSLRNESFPTVDLDLNQAISFLKKGEIRDLNAPKGWFLSTYNSVNLSFANNIGTRINNSFPADWRIRMEIPAQAVDRILKWE